MPDTASHDPVKVSVISRGIDNSTQYPHSMPKQNPNPTKQWLPSPQWRAESTLAAVGTTPDPSPSPSPEPAQLEIHRIEKDGATQAIVFSNRENAAQSIGVSNDGKDVTGQTIEAFAGEEVVLKGVVKSGKGSNWKWTAEGKTVKEFKITPSDKNATKGETIGYKKDDLNKQTVAFHWIEGGLDGESDVTIKATVGGETLTATTTVKVKRPQAGIKATPNGVKIELVAGAVYRAKATIDFTITKLSERGPNYWVQLAALSRITIPHGGDPENEPVESGLDSGCKYPNSKERQTTDEPRIVFGDPPDLQRRFNLQATMYLLWKSEKPGIYVPLRSVAWHFKGKLRSTGAGKAPEWIPVDAQEANPDFKAEQDKEETTYPNWTKCVML